MPLPAPHAAPLFDALVLDIDAVLGGQLWRLWSGHWVHLDAHHATINLVALVLLAVIAARMRQLRPLLWASLLMMPLIGIGLLGFVPTLQWYAGLSGLLHGWAAWLLMRHGGRLAVVGAAVLVVKLIWEQSGAVGGDPMFPVIHEAHLIGAVVGFALALPGYQRQRRRGMRIR
jgi:rhomboid family GlyGly-CTERM serine protease